MDLKYIDLIGIMPIFIYLSSAYPMFGGDIILSNSYGGYFTDGIWCIGKFPYYPLKEDKKANDWDFIVEV